MDPPRLALIGAFPFPLPQGSQVFFEDQARALERASCPCTLFTYGRGAGPPPADLRVVQTSASAVPRRMRSGPSLGKPRADAALLKTLLAVSAREKFDAVIAHNAEAAAVALAARARTGAPVIYVVHTLLGVELSAYLPPWSRRAADAVGRGIDRALARRADGLIVLCEPAATALGRATDAPIEIIAPGFSPQAAPEAEVVRRACERHGLCSDGFVLYAGNLDGYQELDLLDAAAARLGGGGPEVVVATHTDAPRSFEALRVVRVRDFAEVRALSFAAQSLVLARTRIGGFPIKLLNYMETGRPIVAFADVAEGLVHGESAWLMEARGTAGTRSEASAGVWRTNELTRALATLSADPVLRERLGRGARERLLGHHDWSRIAERTRASIEAVLAPRSRARACA